MDGCAGSALFPAHYGIHRVAATLHFSEYRLRERGRRSRAPLVAAECHLQRLAPTLARELDGITLHNGHMPLAASGSASRVRLPGAAVVRRALRPR